MPTRTAACSDAGWTRQRARLLEQPERRASRDLELLEAMHSTPRGREPIRDLFAPPRTEHEEQASPRDVASFFADGQADRGCARLSVARDERHERLGADGGRDRQPPLHAYAAQRRFRENAGDDDAGEQETHDEEKEVVAGIDRGKPDPDGERDVPAAQRGEAQPPLPRGYRAGGRGERAGAGDAHSGAATCSARSRM